jgi:uncharacterized protein (TIGR03118 family)
MSDTTTTAVISAISTHPLKPTFTQTNIISDGIVPASVIDANLINPLGMSFAPQGPFWLAEEGRNLASVDALTEPSGLSASRGAPFLNLLPPISTPSPSGAVFNNFPDAFVLPNGQPATFLFASTNGTISGWNQALGAKTEVDVTTPGAVYTGLAIGTSSTGPTLYAANNAGNTVDMYDSHFRLIKSISFTANLAPFGVAVLNNQLYVTYLPRNTPGSITGLRPVVEQYDLDGNGVAQVAIGSPLSNPYGLAIAPQSFGAFANKLLIGNNGDGAINVFDPMTHEFLGPLTDRDGNSITNPGLWSISPGNGTLAGEPYALYFTAGGTDRQHGVFGLLEPNPSGAQ